MSAGVLPSSIADLAPAMGPAAARGQAEGAASRNRPPAAPVPAPGSNGKNGQPRVRTPLVSAKANDHAAIYDFLAGCFPGLSRAWFKASLDDPFYEPRDRLILRRYQEIHAHVHLTHRVMQFGGLQIPVAGLGWLATAPKCRGQGRATHLLQAAEKRMAQDGALVGLLRTRIPHFFRRTGWALCGRHLFCEGGSRQVLARLLDHGLWRGKRSRLHVRPWRLWEEAALVRIYEQNVAGSYGPFERTPAYWRWLTRRRDYDQLYVAVDGADQSDYTQSGMPVVGYAAVKGERIVELMTLPNRPRVAAQLLVRCCGDAIEQDRQRIVMHTPPGGPLHEVFDEAGGVHRKLESHEGEVFMARLLDPLKLLDRLCGELFRRAQEAGLPRAFELGFAVENRKYQLEFTRHHARAAAGQLGRGYLRLNVADFTRLLLGQLHWERAWAEGRVQATTALAREAAPVLFPRLPLWRPPWDDLT